MTIVASCASGVFADAVNAVRDVDDERAVVKI
jgi:hypothetical protein